MKIPLKLTKLIIIFILATLIVLFFSDRKSNSDTYNISYSLEIYLPFKWNETGLRIVTLQQAIGAKISGKYDRQTRNAHIAFLKWLGAPTNNVPNEPVIQSFLPDTKICDYTEYRQFAHELLDKYNIKIPSIYLIGNDNGFYGPNSDAIFLPVCETKSAVAHEIGHYVDAKAFGLVWDFAAKDAAINFTHSDWIAAKEISPGIEHAAHCIGNILWGYGPYTKCPDIITRNHAKEIIALASNF